MDLLLTHHHQKSRNTTSEYLVQNRAILEILLIVSEFNQTDIHRSVCQFYILLTILRMYIQRAHHEKNKKTDSKIVISENTQIQVLETFISMKFDTECNEITPAIIFLRFNDYYKMLTQMTSKSWSGPTQIDKIEKKQGQIWNQRPLKRWRLLWTLPF